MNDRVLCRVGVDIGGAFTDIVLLLPDGSMTTRKVRSTPADSSVGIVECLTQLLAEYALSGDAIDEIVHGTTVATNMILEYTGARTALLTTAGFREGSPSPTNASDQKKRNTTAECHDLGAFRLAKNSVPRPQVSAKTASMSPASTASWISASVEHRTTSSCLRDRISSRRASIAGSFS